MTDKKADQLQNMSRTEAAERAVLEHYNKEIKNVSDADFIKLVEQMTIGKFLLQVEVIHVYKSLCTL